MNARLAPSAVDLRAMHPRDVDAVLAIEHRAYEFPWSHGNFIDSLAAGYLAEMRVDRSGEVLAYYVAMTGVDELHLLNLTVAPEHQHQGHGLQLLDRLEGLCQARALPRLWLEVRESNHRARAIYARRGFAEVGLRRHYYPAAQGRREHAVLMSREVPPAPAAPPAPPHSATRRATDGLD